MKWTVVIPTLWKSERTLSLLEALNEESEIAEIIVIDNHPEKRPIDLNFNKIKYFPQKENIFVNPAWNKGVAKSSNQHVALCNDDINFDTSIFSMMSSVNFDNTVYGCCPENFNLEFSTNGQVKMTRGHYITEGWGCLLLFDKRFFKPIPKSLLIWCGDDWLVHTFKKSRSFLWQMDTEMSTSSGVEELNQIAKGDKRRFDDMLSYKSKNRINILNANRFGRYNSFSRLYDALLKITRSVKRKILNRDGKS